MGGSKFSHLWSFCHLGNTISPFEAVMVISRSFQYVFNSLRADLFQRKNFFLHLFLQLQNVVKSVKMELWSPLKNENGANSTFFLLTQPKFLDRNPKSNYDVTKVTWCFNCHMDTMCLKGLNAKWVALNFLISGLFVT